MRFALRFSLLVVALLALPDLAAAQFDPSQSYGLVGTLLNLAEDGRVQTELKTTPDQLKALLALRQKVWDNLYSRTPTELKTLIPKDRVAVEAEVKKILRPEQYARARQLAVRIAFGSDGLGDSLTTTRAPREMYVGAGLLDDIRAELTLPPAKMGPHFGGGAIVLTPEQRRDLLRLMGPPLPGPASLLHPLAFDDRFSGFLEVPIELDYLSSPEVRQAVGAPKDVGPKMTTLLDRWEKETQALGVGSYYLSTRMGLGGVGGLGTPEADLSLAQKKEKVDALRATILPELTKAVGAEGVRRAGQIGIQHAARMDAPPKLGLYVAMHLDPVLKPTRAQRTALQRIVNEDHIRAVMKSVRLERDVKAIVAELEALETASAAKASALLTVEQRATLVKVVGQPFDGKLTFDHQFRSGFDAAGGLKASLAVHFGLYTLLDLLALSQPGFKAELKLTEKQIALAETALREINGPVEQSPQKMDERIRTSLNAILTAEQIIRYRELSIQYRQLQAKRLADMPGGGLGLPQLMTALPGIAEALGITADQKKRLLDLEPEANVLTPAQREKLAALAGVPAKAELLPVGGLGNPGGGGSGTPWTFSLLVAPQGIQGGFGISAQAGDIEDDLALTADQLAALAKLADARTKSSREVADLAPEKQKAARETFDKTEAEAIAKLLTPAQRTRLAQIELQVIVANSLGDTLVSWPDLALTNDQKRAIQATREKARDLAKALTGHVGFFPASQLVGLDLREKLDAALLALLTPEQLTRWTNRIGKPVAGLRMQPVVIETPDHLPGGSAGGLP